MKDQTGSEIVLGYFSGDKLLYTTTLVGVELITFEDYRN